MPIFKVTDPQTGKIIQLTGDSPPTEEEIADIFSQLRQNRTDQKKSEAEQSSTSLDRRSEPSLPEDAAREDHREVEGSAETAPDVLLDVPKLRVDELKLIVDGLEARVALSAQLANLVRLDVGVHVGIAKVDLDIKGVDAQAVLKVKLEQVNRIFARALQSLDENPEILRSAPPLTGQALEEVGNRVDGSDGRGGDGRGSNHDEPGTKSPSPKSAPIASSDGQGASNNRELPKGVLSNKEKIAQSIKEASQGIDRSITGRFDEEEESRRRFYRKDSESSE